MGSGGDPALRHPDRVRALVLLEGDARAVALGVGVDVGGPGSAPEVAARDAGRGLRGTDRRGSGRGGLGDVSGGRSADTHRQRPALLAELGYVEEVALDAASFATIDKPTLLVAASESRTRCAR